MPGGAVYKSPPLSPQQEAAAFRVTSGNGSEILGGFVDGAEGSSFYITGRTKDQELAGLLVFVRDGTDVEIAARMLRVMADKLEQQKAPEGSEDPFEGIKTQ